MEGAKGADTTGGVRDAKALATRVSTVTWRSERRTTRSVGVGAADDVTTTGAEDVTTGADDVTDTEAAGTIPEVDAASPAETGGGGS